ncbi:hypothetical protein COT65_01735 [Candidatus Shapirobacteria bacterium CG09_land_8_20_14_0_10_47_13]|uniref:Glycosyltransferase 2-like domain-containing protein n=1 Tax=Candidatus Shapirobacteria bacterium CG09_land_8_20_14_0_10_47_13 TaxID=1974481 RepID=A0A2H0WMK9_9BACT|nr:MAG: hypothetical protein COT65_01735 [Candidatus Shapirobacteria bacterium CG09_land_8_20_14_0_10_47_13]
MKKNKLTVIIPTYNRADLLGRSIQSVLDQSFKEFDLIIIDDKSTDGTPRVVKNFNDSRIKYIKNQKNLGIIGNWNKAIDVAPGKYLSIFHDDDIMSPDFLKEAFLALEANPSVGFTFPMIKMVDINRNLIKVWYDGYKGKTGLISGLEYILLTIRKERCLSLAPSMVFRKKVFKKVGYFGQEFSFNTFDFNRWFKIALNFDVYLINKFLFEYTVHPGQMSQLHWRTPQNPTGIIGANLEMVGAIAHLITNKYAEDKKAREFLSEKLIIFNHKIADAVKILAPSL